MARTGPPAYAWDWFARQRLPWREARSRLVTAGGGAAARYGAVENRGDVVALLRADYPRDDEVRATVHEVIADVVFLGRTVGRFADLGVRSSPRGMRWWWTALTGEELEAVTTTRTGATANRPVGDQLSLDEVLTGYGDVPHPG